MQPPEPVHLDPRPDAAGGPLRSKSPRLRAAFLWLAVASVIIVPLAAAASSPLLAWRQPVYIAAGFAGVLGMALLLVQPLLAAGYLPGLPAPRGRRIHRFTGGLLVLAVLVHVLGLWVTSPPDVVDALLFRSPTLFSAWGVVAMWAILAAGVMAAFRARLRLRPRIWRRIHTALALIVVTGTAVHALLITGTMQTVSKAVLAATVVAVTFKVVHDLRAWSRRAR